MSVTKQELLAEIYPYFANDPGMCLLVGDMGFAVLDDFFQNYPQRTFNVGIAEQATVGIAAGMALAGLKPLVYSQIPFLTMRAFEQIRYDVCEHTLNVKLIGVGAGNYFAQLGRSHCMDKDDLKILSIFEKLLLIDPSPATLKQDVKRMFAYAGPVYVRCQ